MKWFVKIIKSPWFLVPASILAAIGAFFNFLIFGVWHDARKSSMYIFSAVVQRALVDQRTDGRVLLELKDRSEYERVESQFSAFPEGFFLDWDGDCSLPLNLENLDPYLVPGTFQIALSLYAPKVVVFFYGPVPDVSPYLDLKNEDTLLAPRPVDPSALSTTEFLSRTWVDTNDHRRLRGLTSQGKKAIRWRGEACEKYSYIIFKGEKL